ncbi:hypothetical protein GLW05_19875 [Pontibacillus yanchengensis]|uniref:Xylulokinase n=1 Tax=Pontibacillus yanchengensis TaxID=462910 RepID=A0A6I5A6A8_9BACI|nr:FGGY-family carbohydrate kinase [Pontibacillus yanchengensis]MYL35834.1 hypothetical protein [Pontibacillus yanchengensis]
MNYLIGVDIGTQGTKAVLIDTEGKVIAHSYEGYEVETPKPSWAQQWPQIWEEAVYHTIKEVVDNSNVESAQVKGVAISSLYGGSGIPVDENIDPLAPCLIWMDRRAEEEVTWVKNNIDLDRLFEITGNHVNSYFGFTKILWIKNNLPDIWDKINYFIPPAPYIVYKLTGEIAIDYSSAGNVGGVFNLNEKKWSPEMAENLGIPLDMFPKKLVESTEIVGGITKEISQKTGLKEETPVICGGVDAPVATLGAGALEEGNHVAMLGTSMCWGFLTKEPNLSPELVSMPHVYNSEEVIYTFGGAATAGVILRWFRDVIGTDELASEEKLDINAYTLLDMQAKDVAAGSEGLLVLPYFMGERSPIWDSSARGLIMGLSLTHTKAHLYKAFMEGVAYSLRHNMEMVANTSANLDEEIIIVGGGSKSLIWPQIYADVTGHPVKIIKDDVEAPLGDAVLAGIATNTIESPDVVLEWLEFEDTIQPNESNHQVYNTIYQEYKKVYENVKTNMQSLSYVNS